MKIALCGTRFIWLWIVLMHLTCISPVSNCCLDYLWCVKTSCSMLSAHRLLSDERTFRLICFVMIRLVECNNYLRNVIFCHALLPVSCHIDCTGFLCQTEGRCIISTTLYLTLAQLKVGWKKNILNYYVEGLQKHYVLQIVPRFFCWFFVRQVYKLLLSQ